MARNKNVKSSNEQLEKTFEEVQNELPEDVLSNNKTDIQEPNKNNQVDLEDKEKKEEINTISIGSRVKINPSVSNDCVGRRIHNGVKNYTYTVKSVRTDGFCTVECLTYVFTVNKKDLILI